MDGKSTRELVEEIKLSHQSRGVARLIFALLLENGCKVEDMHDIFIVVTHLYTNSREMLDVFNLMYNDYRTINKQRDN